MSELLQKLRQQGVRLSEGQVRWALRTGKVHRPPIDGGLRFVFDTQHVEEFQRMWEERNGLVSK